MYQDEFWNKLQNLEKLLQAKEVAEQERVVIEQLHDEVEVLAGREDMPIEVRVLAEFALRIRHRQIKHFDKFTQQFEEVTEQLIDLRGQIQALQHAITPRARTSWPA
jgi:hypothetical protein